MIDEAKIAYEKVEKGSYEVFYRGQYMGKVHKGWFRLGGESWTTDHHTSAGATRKEAAKRLISQASSR